MTTVSKSVLIWYSAEEMYALVVDVPRYPQFLPWCDHASAQTQPDDSVLAELGISFSGIRQTFSTRNTQQPGRSVVMRLVSGPFSQLQGEWRFTPLGDAAQRACRVELDLSYGFSNGALAALVGPVFDKIAATMVDAFVKRAEQVYG